MDKFVVRVPHSRPEHQQEPAPKRLKQSRIEQFQKTHAPAAPLEQSVRLRAGTRHKPQKHLQQVRIEDLKKVVSQKEVLQLKEQVQSGKVEDILCAFERLESLHMTKEVLKVSPGLVGLALSPLRSHPLSFCYKMINCVSLSHLSLYYLSISLSVLLSLHSSSFLYVVVRCISSFLLPLRHSLLF